MAFLNFLKKSSAGQLEGILKRICDNIVLIPPGSFLMGSYDGEDDERPVHNVLIDGFYMGKYQVTQAEWYALMGTKPWLSLKYLMDGDNYPVVNVSWYDAWEFIKKLNKLTKKEFRLPTEAEWEYACRAGTKTRFFHGISKQNLQDYAWFYENAFKKGEMYAHQVGQKKPNKWGLYDMLGNVYEWCSDWYKRNYYHRSPIDNPKGPKFGRGKVVRGGDWARTDYFLRVTTRGYYSQHDKDSYIGFRLVGNLIDRKG